MVGRRREHLYRHIILIFYLFCKGDCSIIDIFAEEMLVFTIVYYYADTLSII